MWRLFRRRHPPMRAVPVANGNGRERAAADALRETERKSVAADALSRRLDLLAAEIRQALGGHR